MQVKIQPIPLKPVHSQSVVVAAVDTSTMKVAETSEGIIVAIRAATVLKQNRAYRYTRVGPFIFHITEENRRQVLDTLESSYLRLAQAPSRRSAPNLLQMPTRIASLFEKWLQSTLAKTVDHGLLLFDGSLTSGTADAPTQFVRDTLSSARKRANVILAFSKVTNLRTHGRLITDLELDREPPYLLETEGLQLKPPMLLLGDIYVARLTRGNCAFRLDIDKEVPPQIRVEAVQQLLGNDLFAQSYPETLRLAHILCTFTANEVLAIQHFVTRNCGLRIINRPDMHRLLFGPFGREDFS